MKVQLVLAISCLLSFTACNNANRSPKAISNTEVLERAGKAPGMNAGSGRFTVATPAGWTKTDTVVSRVHYTFLKGPMSADSLFQVNVNIVSQQVKEGVTVDDYMEGTESQMESIFDNYKKLDTGERPVTGVTAKWLKYRFSNNDASLWLSGQISVLVKNNITYVVTLTTPADELEKYSPVLDTILDSFVAN
ncbi:hypothetical protein J2T02_001526 [Chitinophaga terrae (ex Kim and Jung 2007)]|jgi:hypothetical protein|uniref:DcrB-related protein n=1 Tax=Chitinophaga terrae (ex Kim and Jung 2007) TaxID=408074 RepID=UPI00278154CB|nr:DcrB-related protein [Chitinophaga terrae (ex Kim and Jung 2007)]MDQ0106418.1 hypothetical protein [Chitinophaga terrae (ex Kim and Jung 2007)]